MAVLRTSSISTYTKELHVNDDDEGIVYIDHREHGQLVAAFTIDRLAWEDFIEEEYKRLFGSPQEGITG